MENGAWGRSNNAIANFYLRTFSTWAIAILKQSDSLYCVLAKLTTVYLGYPITRFLQVSREKIILSAYILLHDPHKQTRLIWVYHPP
jgi:hypothetical protein